jgi:SH3 domain protein
MKRRSLALAVLALTCWIPAAAADTAYVIDKLLVGVHQDRDLNSAIIKVLPTGTKLDVLKRDGELALIKDPEGTNGWVDAAYLMEEPPATLKLEMLSDENAALAAKLKAGAGATATNADPAASEERDELTKENTELKRKLSAAKLKTEELQGKVSRLESEVAERPITPADTVIAELEAANKTLARELEAAVQNNKELESELDQPQTLPILPVVVESFSTPVLAGIAVALLLAFGGGVYLMDYLNRRRHGGFRV